MKKFIQRINTILIEKYPLIWNTRLVWMLATSIIFHLLFFISGYVTATNNEVFHSRSTIDIFFENGTVLFGIIISILQIVIWLVYLFKNNAFKNFYPTKTRKLFRQFLIYLVIILTATTYYYSYVSGLKLFVNQAFPDKVMAKQIELANDTSLFLSQEFQSYKLNRLKYPEAIDSLYCETRESYINHSLPHFSFLDDYYQFYSLRTKERFHNRFDETSMEEGFVYTQHNDSSSIYFYRDTVVDVSKYVNTANPSYFNHSNVFYNKETLNSNYYIEDLYDSSENDENKNNSERNKRNHELLNRNDPEEIKKLLSDYIDLIDSHKIGRNINADQWFNEIYNTNFELKWLMRNGPKDTNNPYQVKSYYEEDIVQLSKVDSFARKIRSNYFIETGKLYNTFENIDEVKSTNVIPMTIHIYLWCAFILSCLVFAFRVTSLRSLLFSIVAGGLIVVFIALTAILFKYVNNYSGDIVEYFVFYLVLIVCGLIIVLPFVFINKLKKSISGIFINLSLFAFPTLILVCFGLVSMHQSDACREISMNRGPGELAIECFEIFEYLGAWISYILFAVSLLFMFLYLKFIQKWKALPES